MVSFQIVRVLLLATVASIASATPVNFGMILFPGFTPLDVFGPLEVLNAQSRSVPLNLYTIAQTLDPVTTRPVFTNGLPNSNFSQAIVPTHTFASPPPDLDVLFVPGGGGTRAVNLTDPAQNLSDLTAYIRDVYPSLQYLVSICTGAQLVAISGVLDGRTATTNKQAFNYVAPFGPRTYWRAHARWVVDGNVYTSAGVSAGIDATLKFVEDIWGGARADQVSQFIEHVRVTSPEDDPFSQALGLVDISPIKQS